MINPAVLNGDDTINIVAVCCNVLQCVAEWCSVLQFVAVCCSALHCVALCGNVLQRVAVCCSVLQLHLHEWLHCAASSQCCSVLHRRSSDDAAHCNTVTMHHTATIHGDASQCDASL